MSELLKFIEKLSDREHLTRDEAARAMQIIMYGGATPAQMASFLTAIRINGDTAEEIAGCAYAIRVKAIKIHAPDGAIDVCGTGGDKVDTLNISTATAFVVAGAGVPVAKHGNRAVSSLTGSSDILSTLGVNLSLDPQEIQRCLDSVGMCYMPAPVFHSSMRHIAPIRAELGFRTLFNILGPICNPAGVKKQIIGVYGRGMVPKLAAVLQELGSEHVWVVHGEDGVDELSITTTTHVAELKNGEIRTFTLTPEDAGLPVHSNEEIKGGDNYYNAKALQNLLAGEQGGYRDVVLLNAAAALIVADKAKDLKEGVAIAAQSIDSGAAKKKLADLVQATGFMIDSRK